MKEIFIKDILRETKGKLIIGNENEKVESFSNDTRNIQENDTYIAIVGENFDGNKFWKEALDNGAKAVIIQGIDFEKEDLTKYKNKSIIEVENTLEALYKIAEYKRSLYDIPVVAITGSVGKTSTKDIVANVVSQKYKTLKTEGNHNNNIGLSFTILKLSDHEAAVLEMGMNHSGEISLLTRIAKPTISIITNIGTSHIGNLGSRENILKAKLEILEGMKEPCLILNNDNDMLHNYYEKNKDIINIKTYGMENESDIQPNNIRLEENKGIYTCKCNNKEIEIKVPVGGAHFILNSLCACKVGELLNLSNSQIKNGIESFKLTNKRMDITKLDDEITIINDSYNASYESVKAALKYLTSLKSKRKIAILGDMFELGDFSVELHKKVGKEVAKNKIDILICSGENSKYIYEEAIKNGMDAENAYYLKDKNEIIKYIKLKMEKGDTILFKASNGMKFYDIADELINNIKNP